MGWNSSLSERRILLLYKCLPGVLPEMIPIVYVLEHHSLMDFTHFEPQQQWPSNREVCALYFMPFINVFFHT